MSRIESVAAQIIGDRLRSARVALGLSRNDLGYHARVDPTSLNRYENGKAIPNLSTLVRLAGTLGVDPGSLVSGLSYLDFPQDRETPQPIPRPRKSSTG